MAQSAYLNLVDTNSTELIEAPGATSRLQIIAITGTNLSASSVTTLTTFDDDQSYDTFALADNGGGFAFTPAEGWVCGVNQAFSAQLDNTSDPNVIVRVLYRIVGAAG
jgi:hypothetical protein